MAVRESWAIKLPEDADENLAKIVRDLNKILIYISQIPDQDVDKGSSPTFKDLVLSKSPSVGVKVDNDTPTFGWADMIGNLQVRNTGASKPAFITYRDTLSQFEFAAGEEEWLDFHLPHDYAMGTDLHLHVHWSHNSAIVTGGSLTFTYEISYSKGHNQDGEAFPASVSTTFIGDASTTQYRHIITETQISAPSPDANQLNTNDLEPDGLILCRLEMTTNNITSSGAIPDPFIHFVDIHYQTIGVTGTKQKEPDFYV